MECPNCQKSNSESAISCACGYVFKGYTEEKTAPPSSSSSSGGGDTGNVIFIILHLIGVFTGFWMLIFTIPLHLIYNKMGK